ncbi:hypothetical protein [Streptomyces sp. NPDC048341]|uniref:hypothetical protein n=1 Tax=Streptomyces sp. NPDC048341 TaxID=3154620 RepID=UPI00343E1CB3
MGGYRGGDPEGARAVSAVRLWPSTACSGSGTGVALLMAAGSYQGWLVPLP